MYDAIILFSCRIMIKKAFEKNDPFSQCDLLCTYQSYGDRLLHQERKIIAVIVVWERSPRKY